MTDTVPQTLRSDARENRDRVLDAARDLFAQSGLGVSMREIARHAGVGPATLYRRFPTKQTLVVEAFMDELHACRKIVHTGAADPDAWRGFCSVVERLTELNARNRGFTDAFLAAHPEAIDFAAHRREMLKELAGIAARAQASGDLRADFVLDDFILVLLAGRGLTATPDGSNASAARRFAALIIDGSRAASGNRPLPKPPRLLESAIGSR
ncbi:TetR/AcrR family transcriptional regulator [Leifsonia sp. NPDC058292]|uniref:TetR/AcrR family transcriptional regulator n=1 Tax=Leifsonia sp. NPDC058292 TaxID=3346428 RepID=UPI0036DD685F